MQYMKLQHELIHAQYNESSGKWHLRLRRPSSDSSVDNIQFEEFEDTADVLFTGVGSLSRWKWPEIEGLHDFKGRLVHSGNWDVTEGVDNWGDKKVGVIGVVCHCLLPT